MQGEGGSWRACLVIGVIIAVLLSGCTATRLSACCGQEPIIGTWFYDPAGSTGTSTDELTLFIVKDGGRFDAAAIPRNQTKPLTYEIWITGSWEKVGAYLYTLTGQSIHHDFVTDNHTTAEYKNTLSYHPDSDTLSPPSTVDPYGSFIRKSYKPEIPPGLNVSIPWD